MRVFQIAFAVLAGLALAEVSSGAAAPAKGHLVIHGGGVSRPPMDELTRLAGGPEARIVVLATGTALLEHGESHGKALRERGVAEVLVRHTNDRAVADSEEYAAAIESADGVWLVSARQHRMADTYLGTRTENALHELLERGGVIGGGSACATIQGSYLVRGDSRGNLISMGDHEEGFGLFEGATIDQHFLERNRHFDLLEVIRARPGLLGIGIDEDAFIVAHGDEFRVMGKGFVAIYDPAIVRENGRFYFLEPGERYHLPTNTPLSRSGEPLWLPHIVPRARLAANELEAIAGAYRLDAEGGLSLRRDGERIFATLCPGDERELIPISRDLFYDRYDGSKITLQRDARGRITGLTWKLDRMVGQSVCREGTVVAVRSDDRTRLRGAGPEFSR